MLVNATEMLKKAKAGHYAVGQFNINNLVTSQNPLKIAFGDGILTCMSRDFGMFMPKHLAG